MKYQENGIYPKQAKHRYWKLDTIRILFEFATLKSVYSKTVYRFLKQYRKTGFWKVSLEDFKSLLSIPESYQASNIDNRVLKPVMKELPSIFKGLKVHKIKSRRRGNQLLGYEFTFQKKALRTGLMTNMINQETQKKHQLAVKFQTGMTLITKMQRHQKNKRN